MDSIQKKSLKYTGMYRGVVVDTADPYQLGRIRIKVFPMFVGIETEQLPWATPAMPLFTGAGAGFSSFAVPHLETFVFVFFENGDPYQPVYFAEAQTGTHGLPLFAYDDYPFSKVLQSKQGIVFQIKDKEGEETVLAYHPKGSYIMMDKDGNLTAYAHKEASLVAETDDVNVVAAATSVNIAAKQNVNIQAEQNVNIQAEGNIVATAVGSASVTAGGTATIQSTLNATIQSVRKVVVQSADNTEVTAVKKVKITAAEDVDVNAVNVNVQASGDANVNGATVSITGSGQVEIMGGTVQIN